MKFGFRGYLWRCWTCFRRWMGWSIVVMIGSNGIIITASIVRDVVVVVVVVVMIVAG